MNHNLPKKIPPGKIRCALNLLKGKKDIVLMADGIVLEMCNKLYQWYRWR